MIIEKIYAAFVIIIGIAFVYQYGRRLVSENKLHALEEDVNKIVDTINMFNGIKCVGGYPTIESQPDKSKRVSWILSEITKLMIKAKTTEQ